MSLQPAQEVTEYGIAWENGQEQSWSTDLESSLRRLESCRNLSIETRMAVGWEGEPHLIERQIIPAVKGEWFVSKCGSREIGIDNA